MSLTRQIADDWRESEYYGLAEDQDTLDLFWGQHSPFLRMFQFLNLNNVLELACGRGRHLPHYAMRAVRVTLVDVNVENIEFCRTRHSALASKVTFTTNNGSDLSTVESASLSSLFCYDAMVHFEVSDVISYLAETWRILAPGSYALFHHSNYAGNPGRAYNASHDFGWRNYMTCSLFTHLAMRNGFDVKQQQILGWGGVPCLDGLTLLLKPKE